jgi:hypothetical protein
MVILGQTVDNEALVPFLVVLNLFALVSRKRRP